MLFPCEFLLGIKKKKCDTHGMINLGVCRFTLVELGTGVKSVICEILF